MCRNSPSRFLIFNFKHLGTGIDLEYISFVVFGGICEAVTARFEELGAFDKGAHLM